MISDEGGCEPQRGDRQKSLMHPSMPISFNEATVTNSIICQAISCKCEIRWVSLVYHAKFRYIGGVNGLGRLRVEPMGPQRTSF